MWPFGCSGCKSKDSEIAFLRGLLSSMRSIVRDPSQDPERRKAVEYATSVSHVGQAVVSESDDEPQPSGYFLRDPVQDFIPKDDR